MHNPFVVNDMFEDDLCEYTGAPYCVLVKSCTDALRLALKWWHRGHDGNGWIIDVPERTYTSVPMAVKWAGLGIRWIKMNWKGEYDLYPTNIWDSAKRLKRDMFRPGMMQCLSFHPQKPLALPDGGGAILHDDPKADIWFRKIRHDGRTQNLPTNCDRYEEVGEHCHMFPHNAAYGIMALGIYATRDPHEDMPSELDRYPGPENHVWNLEYWER